MSREEYIRDLGYFYLIYGPTARWNTASEDERTEAKLLIDKLLDCIIVPDPVVFDVPDDEYTAMAMAVGASALSQ